MHCGVMVTGYNQGDWERLLASLAVVHGFDAVQAVSELTRLLR